MRVREESEKAGLTLNIHSKNEDHGIQSHHFMANRGEKVEAVICFIFLGSKITMDSDSNHKVKRLLGRSNLSIFQEINREDSLEELRLKLKLQYCGHRMGRADSLKKALMLGKTEGSRRRG